MKGLLSAHMKTELSIVGNRKQLVFIRSLCFRIVISTEWMGWDEKRRLEVGKPVRKMSKGSKREKTVAVKWREGKRYKAYLGN